MLTINNNGHFENNGKVLKSLTQVLKASTNYYLDKDCSFLALSADSVEACIFTKGNIHNTETYSFSVVQKKLEDTLSKTGHDSILWSEAGIQELTKLALKRRQQWIKKNIG